MRREELLRALRRLAVETGSLACLGCGYEHNCSIHGCAVIREAAEALEEPPNAPLTLEELREMDGEPVWDKAGNCFIIRINVHGTDGYGADKFATYTKLDILCERGLYRNKPEEDNE